MAFIKCSGGGSELKLTNILDINNTAKNTWTTYTLTNSINNYKYLWISMREIYDNDTWLMTQNTSSYLDATAYSGHAFCKIDYFKSNAINMYYTVGNSDNLAAHKLILQYVSDTQVKHYKTNGNARPLRIYGIKIK